MIDKPPIHPTDEETPRPLQVLVVITDFNWPIRDGSTVIAYHLTEALRKQGHQVDLFTSHTSGEVPARPVYLIPKEAPKGKLSRKLARLARYFNAPASQVLHFGELSHKKTYDVCLGIGAGACPYLVQAQAKSRFWILGDNPLRNACLFFLTELFHYPIAAFRELFFYARQALFLRFFRPKLNGISWVTAKDRRWSGLYIGAETGIVLPNGVSTMEFECLPTPRDRHLLAFWGNLSYFNNIHAIEWFYHRVFAELYKRNSLYRFIIAGSFPDKRVRRIAEMPGVELRENPENIEECLKDCAVGVFPFQFSTGIKNKVLESAAMGKATFVSPCIRSDFFSGTSPPFTVCQKPQDWIECLQSLVQFPEHTDDRRLALLQWVKEFYDWTSISHALIKAATQGIEKKEKFPPPAPSQARTGPRKAAS
ncbi:MAG: glycosyltransferase [Bdellovibrionota bacterium]